MVDFVEFIAHKRWILIVGFVIIIDLFLMTLLASTAHSHHVSAEAQSTVSAAPAHAYDGPNVITDGFLKLNDDISGAFSSINKSLYNGVDSIAMGASQSGELVSHGAKTVSSLAASGVKGGFGGMAHAAGGGFGATGHAVGSAFTFMGRTVVLGSLTFVGRDVIVGSYAFEWHALQTGVGGTFGLVSHMTNVGSLITPANTDNKPVPVIDEGYSTVPLAKATKLPLKTISKSAPKVDVTPQWPIHGAITTLFGVPELPYEAIHTGLDIADGAAPGVTPIRPFKPGRVAQVIHSGLGLGNHVVVDHGNGMTSVYGHMDSTSVSVGQWVDEKTVLGLEGETGVATGVHLHFEIRINGTAVNPLNYINGRP